MKVCDGRRPYIQWNDPIVSGARVNLCKRFCAEVEVLKTFQRVGQLVPLCGHPPVPRSCGVPEGLEQPPFAHRSAHACLQCHTHLQFDSGGAEAAFMDALSWGSYRPQALIGE